MSEHEQTPADSGAELPRIPVSHGVVPSVRVFLVVAILIAFMQGSFTVLASREFHVWPAADATKVALPPLNLK